MPINIARLIWNAKSQFGIKCTTRSDLRPETVVTKLNELLYQLSVVPGASANNNKYMSMVVLDMTE